MRAVIVVGLIGGTGLAMVLFSLLPAQPDLRGALARLNPDRNTLERDRALAKSRTDQPVEMRLGMWVDQHLTRWLPLRVPDSELRLLGLSRQRFLGEKLGFAAIGALFPYLAAAGAALLGVGLPVAIPVVASLGLAAGLSFLPDAEVRRKAAAAREEFAHAAAAYMDLVALERAAGSGTAKSLEAAASVADTWVFRRIREELARARWAGTTPWAALNDLSTELRIPELANMADIMSQAGESGVAVYDHLRAASKAMRTAQLSKAQAAAKARTEKISMPQVAAGLVFLLILILPQLWRMMASVTGG